MEYSLLSPQQLAKVFTSVPGRAINMFSGMFSDSTLVSVSKYLSPEFIASISPSLPLNDVVRVIPQLDKSLVAKVFACTPQTFNEDVLAALHPNYVVEMFNIVPRHLNIATFTNFDNNKAHTIQHLFHSIEVHFPELQSRIHNLKMYCNHQPQQQKPNNDEREEDNCQQSNVLRIRF